VLIGHRFLAHPFKVVVRALEFPQSPPWRAETGDTTDDFRRSDVRCLKVLMY
jgi:hypothetical protein